MIQAGGAETYVDGPWQPEKRGLPGDSGTRKKRGVPEGGAAE